MDFVLFAALLLVALTVQLLWKRFNQPKSKNPFVLESCAPRPIVFDRNERKKVLKKAFKIELVPSNLDAIVIGSGVGGLSCASLLSRAGKRVLVLEQHDRIGGGTHTYKTKGFEYDIGIHYVGDMLPGSLLRCYVDLLTDSQLEWSELVTDFDTVIIDDHSQKDPRKYVYVKGLEAFKKRLYKYFPDEKLAIDRFFELLKDCKSSTNTLLLLKLLPKTILKIAVKLGLDKWLFKGYDYVAQNTVADIMDKLTDNKDLKTVLVYSFGDYGALPSESSFLMHGLLTNHLVRSGGFYPIGGASEIAYQIIPSIEKTGGMALVGAMVSEIIIENGRACGVRVRKTLNPKVEDVIRAPIIVSAAGIFNTYNAMIPKHICDYYGVMSGINCVEPGVSCFQVMVGLEGTKEDLGLEAENFWIFTSNEPDKDTKKFLSMTREEAANSEIPIMFLSFPSTKDPTWNKRYPNKTTCAVVTFASMSWFEEWKDEKVKKRGTTYQNLKSTLIDQTWKQVVKIFPQLKDKVVTIDGGTPLTHKFYLNSMHGEIYGMHHSNRRFFVDQAINLRPETPIPGLYLSGQDVFVCGFSGAAFSGLVTASKILNRYLISDLMKYTKKVRKNKPKMH